VSSARNGAAGWAGEAPGLAERARWRLRRVVSRMSLAKTRMTPARWAAMETGNLKLENGNSKLETRNWKVESGSPARTNRQSKIGNLYSGQNKKFRCKAGKLLKINKVMTY
jgi:hypothetical protein